MSQCSEPPAAVASPATDDPGAFRVGLFYALAAYLWWGFMPLYFARLAHVSPWVVVSHRVVWSVMFLLAVVAAQRRWPELIAAMRSRRTLAALCVSAIFIAVNWLVFVYAIGQKQVMQAALGYYINPLIYVVLGLVVLGERLRPVQWVSVMIATAGVALAAFAYDAFPWIALTLATSFALYGLIRKLVPVGPITGLLVETAVLLPLAAGYLARPVTASAEGPVDISGADHLLLAAGGVVTSLPLLWFAAAVRRLPLTTIGFLQYLSPTTQFFVALCLMGEPLDPRKLQSFALIWLALALFSYDAYRARRVPASSTVELVE